MATPALASAGGRHREAGQKLLLATAVPVRLGKLRVRLKAILEVGHESLQGPLVLGGIEDLLLGPGLIVGRLRIEELRQRGSGRHGTSGRQGLGSRLGAGLGGLRNVSGAGQGKRRSLSGIGVCHHVSICRVPMANRSIATPAIGSGRTAAGRPRVAGWCLCLVSPERDGSTGHRDGSGRLPGADGPSWVTRWRGRPVDQCHAIYTAGAGSGPATARKGVQAWTIS